MVTTFSKYFLLEDVTKAWMLSSKVQMTTTNDLIIIKQIQDGNTKMFSVLVDRYKDLVFSLVIGMMKNREEAEEVCQDTFIKVYKSLDKFKGTSKLSTWIYKIAYNTSLDRIKKNKRSQHVVPIDEFTTHEVKTLDNALSRMEQKEREERIASCLKLLPSEDSFILTLFYFEDQSLEEISKVVGIKTNHVKVKLFRSRKKLATILRKNLEPELIEHYERASR